jgi:hypothetical protein
VKSTVPNNAFISALLSGSVIVAIPAFAAGQTGRPGHGITTENTADGTIDATTNTASSAGALTR